MHDSVWECKGIHDLECIAETEAKAAPKNCGTAFCAEDKALESEYGLIAADAHMLDSGRYCTDRKECTYRLCLQQ